MIIHSPSINHLLYQVGQLDEQPFDLPTEPVRQTHHNYQSHDVDQLDLPPSSGYALVELSARGAARVAEVASISFERLPTLFLSIITHAQSKLEDQSHNSH